MLMRVIGATSLEDLRAFQIWLRIMEFSECRGCEAV
jgi:hypothetical protein